MLSYARSGRTAAEEGRPSVFLDGGWEAVSPMEYWRYNHERHDER